ncbi:MAG TPA: hypothetical protein VE992_03920 [Solirubrobacteraceae bacterium]|nr:hypothetical protein [Solirubrobacteraceae bacterium]
MTYLPELRESLVRAAAEMGAAQSGRTGARRRSRSFAAFGLALASVTALVVAGVVLVLAGSRGGQPAGQRPVSLSAHKRAQVEATKLLAEFRPPPGAVPETRNLTRGEQGRGLGLPPSPADGAVDLHRFWRLRGDVQTVMSQVHVPAAGDITESGSAGSASASSASASASAQSVTYSMTSTYDLGPVGDIWRQLQVEAAVMPGGGTEIRVDALAWPGVVRPASERIPGDVTQIDVDVTGKTPDVRHPPRRRTVIRDSSSIAAVVAYMNSLQAVQPDWVKRTGAAPHCGAPPNLQIRVTFVLPGSGAPPLAVLHPACGTIDLSLNGRGQPPLEFAPAVGSLSTARTFERVMNLLAGVS